ncbi:zinc ribbon domain-containing protein [Slackia isoflavoniconvertens]|uniref:zinc ribbon domain-containing protein n=1 Tax=Slackia isoflavoniconvertens TaxID=572010 RepID=UPI00248ECFA8|nr:zinc ribbon domain-containing protein [Slackia isoflavoniconvertens]
MYCTKCGTKLPRDARFCMNCGKPVAAIAPTKVVEPTGAPAKAVNPAAASREAAAPAAAPAKAVVSTFASEAADSGRNDVSSSDASSNGSLQSDSSFSDSSLESAAFADEPEKSCEAGACGASSVPQEDVSPKRPETLRGAVNATKHRSRRRVPMVVLVALAMALAAGTAYAAYRVYTDVWLPAQQTQNEQTVEAPEEITYSVETRSMDVSVPVDPYDAPGKREAQKWYYPHIEASTQSDAVDKINAALEESMRTDVEKTNAAPDTAKDMGGAIVFICQYRSITLTYIDNDIVCVRDQRYDTGWGPHGSTTVTGCAYSLETGDPIDPVSAFGLTPEQAKSAVADAVTVYLATDPSDILSTNAVVRDITNMCLMSPALGSGVDVENPLDGCSHFYIASEGLVFATEDYQMGSYAYGRREILVAPSDGSLAKIGDTVAVEAPMGFSGSGQASSQ